MSTKKSRPDYNKSLQDYENLKKSCKFFNGELHIPRHLNDIEGIFWLAESAAATAVLEGREDDFLDGYKKMGEPGAYSKLPPIILASLFGLYCKGAERSPEYYVKPFETLIIPRYIASTSMKI